MAELSRFKFTVSLPGEAEGKFCERLEQLKHYYENRQALVESLIAYDMWAQKDHLLTGPCFRPHVRRVEVPAMWTEILRDFNKPNKTGSWFEHRLHEINAQRGVTSTD